MTQAEMVYDALCAGPLTSMDAINRYGFTRLAARIKDLREIGVEIDTTYETSLNRFGKPVSYATYKLPYVRRPTSFAKPKKVGRSQFLAGMMHATKFMIRTDPSIKGTPLALALRDEILKVARR